MHTRPPRHSDVLATRRVAFTLIELLIAITIFAILSTLAISAFRESDQDRAAASSQLLRSMLEGARSRAIHDRAPRGIRLILDPTNRRMVTAAVYIGAPEQFVGVLDDLDSDGWHSQRHDRNHDGLVDANYSPPPGQLVFSEPGTPADDDMDGLTNDEDEYGWELSDDAIVATVDNGVAGFVSEWKIRENVVWPVLRQRKLLASTREFIGARIKIPARSNVWFPIVGIDSPFGPTGSRPKPDSFPFDVPDPQVPGAVRITIAGQYPYVEPTRRPLGGGRFQEFAKVTADSVVEYVIELAPPILPGSVPQTFANGVAIDLDSSKVPSSWFVDNITNPTSPTPGTLTDDGYIDHLDILFTPRGEVAGPAAAAGVMNFVFTEIREIDEAYLDLQATGTWNLRYPTGHPLARMLGNDPTREQPPIERLVTLFTRTGQVITSQVNRGFIPGGPYELALTGQDAP